MKTQMKTTSKKAILPHADISSYLARWLVGDYARYETKYGNYFFAIPKLAEITWNAYNRVVLTPYRARYRKRWHKPELPVGYLRQIFCAWLSTAGIPSTNLEFYKGSFTCVKTEMLWCFWMAAHRNLFRRF